ncbi:tyrosine-type recombinase/integrase [Botrimarina mediterranea]|uniref:Tyrosine recombinase XerC n=1 Tax=Botrimarina mediterranea TaxID=2528022 RepID=A0A518K216_9BACT|nr:tyrosine-type recombinase/integrase [Botrimarina mediterranea]QDV71858.1 Tyrosine recombinase XerC [Botrimarina mediterranea]
MAHGAPEPWFRKGRGWFVTIGGKQQSLRTRDKREAYERWHDLMAAGPTVAYDAGDDPLVVDLLAMFCEWAEKHLAPSSYDWYRRYLHSFVRFLPAGLTVARLKPLAVTQWLDANPGWSASSRRAAITSVKRALSWAEQQGAIQRSPLAHVKRPSAPRRTVTLTEADKKTVLNAATDVAFRELITAAELSGVRPQELRRVEARHFDARRGTWLFPQEENKTGEATGRPRVVFLPPALVELSKRLAKENPTGPLFRNAHGGTWTANAIRCRFRRMKAKLGDRAPKGLYLYAYRHTFATDALENGLNPMTVAELLGHADASTLSRVYQHLADRHDHMSEAIRRAIGNQ